MRMQKVLSVGLAVLLFVGCIQMPAKAQPSANDGYVDAVPLSATVSTEAAVLEEGQAAAPTMLVAEAIHQCFVACKSYSSAFCHVD